MKRFKVVVAAMIAIAQLWLIPGEVSLADMGNTDLDTEQNQNLENKLLDNQKLDIMFVLDITGSMNGKIDKFQEQALDIMLEISLDNQEARFGMAFVADYPGQHEWQGYLGKYGTALSEPFRLVHGLDPDIYSVYETIAGIEPVDGWDAPEAYTRALYELGELEFPEDLGGWRKDARKLVIFIGDTWTHDLSFAGMNSGGDPGRDALAGTADDLEFCSVVQALEDKGIVVHAVNCDDNKYSRATMKGMSEGFERSAGTGGSYISLEDIEELANAIKRLIHATILP